MSANSAPVGTITSGSTWNTFTTTFTATSGSTLFQISEGIGGGNGGVFLDNIDVSAVPEPATWAMMLAGFGMIGFGLRSRRKQAVRVTYA
ncbi:MAG: FxDxF family PEP-CTERM protein [Novosphingobium sp.]|nr:FxDxF family PEP-CTERM protein [Novosphingobium sp.]